MSRHTYSNDKDIASCMARGSLPDTMYGLYPRLLNNDLISLSGILPKIVGLAIL